MHGIAQMFLEISSCGHPGLSRWEQDQPPLLASEPLPRKVAEPQAGAELSGHPGLGKTIKGRWVDR